MPVTISLTKRTIRNKTGMDGSATSYGPSTSPKFVKDYHVVIITKLPFFKLPQHSEEDTVQFMVPRDFSAFEKLQKDILVAFPELKLPSLPRKFLMFISDADIEERMVSFDCIVKIVVRSKEMCTSAPMLDFLGFDLTADKKYYKARRQYLQKKEEEAEDKKKFTEEVYGDRATADSDLAFFGGGSSDEPFSDDSQKKSQPYTIDSIFEEEDKEKSSKKRSAKVAILEDDSIDLFDTKKEPASEVKTEVKTYGEDNSELLNVSDTLEDVLKLVKDDKKSTAKKVMADTPSKGKQGGLFDLDDDLTTNGGVDAMGGDDIMKYILQNQQTNADDDLDFL